MANSSANSKSLSKSLSVSSGSKSAVHHPQPIRSIASNKLAIGNGPGGQVASFLIKTVALEALRRFSRARCPSIWAGLQGFQLLCYPPLKWIQRWKPFGFLVKGMQMISQPLLLLSIVDAVSDLSNANSVSNDTENSQSDDDSHLGSGSLPRSPSLHQIPNTVNGDEHPEGLLSIDWLNQLYQELDNQGISLPERFNREELERFHVASNGDIPVLVSSIKKTVRWRETYRILSEEELEIWSNMIFWHGIDVKNRPCLIIRLGMGCRLPSCERPRFVQAIVSQVEYGVLNLVGRENPQITVLMDCHGLSPLRFPMQTLRYCCNVFQDHFPNLLGCLIVIRLPSVVRVITQTFIQVLKPTTKQKLRIEGEAYRKFLSEIFPTVPSYLGGQCSCTRCTNISSGSQQQIYDIQTNVHELSSGIEDYPSTAVTFHQDDTAMYCSQTLRAAIIGIIIVWALIALIEGIYNPESRPTLRP